MTSSWRGVSDRELLRGRRREEFLDVIEQDGDLLVVLGHFAGEVGVFGQDVADADEGSHDFDVHFDGAFAAEDGRQHGYALFGEGVCGVAPSTPT